MCPILCLSLSKYGRFERPDRVFFGAGARATDRRRRAEAQPRCVRFTMVAPLPEGYVCELADCPKTLRPLTASEVPRAANAELPGGRPDVV
jgi:hypothetical protein